MLVVEDDADISDLIVTALQRDGYDVAHVMTGALGIDRTASLRPAAVILDLGLPDIDGLEVCRQIRAAGYEGPVIIATARTSESDIAASRAAGADYFLRKPFGLAELLTCVRELTIRAAPARGSAAVTHGALSFDTRTRQAHLDGALLPVTGKEFDLVLALALDPTAIVLGDDLRRLFSEEGRAARRLVETTVKRLNDKLRSAGAEGGIRGTYDQGYRLAPEA